MPADLYHEEWERRRLRNIVHLTIGGCLGPCALANVALLLFDGKALWFHSMNSAALVYALYDYIDHLLDVDPCAPPPSVLAPYQFTASAWQDRPDGQPVDDHRPRIRRGHPVPVAVSPAERDVVLPASGSDRLVAELQGRAAVPRRNGELVFDAPWQGRAFGLAAALAERGLFTWDEFRQCLIASITAAERRDEPFEYYACWLEAFESILRAKGVVYDTELDARTFEFEFGERDEVF